MGEGEQAITMIKLLSNIYRINAIIYVMIVLYTDGVSVCGFEFYFALGVMFEW